MLRRFFQFRSSTKSKQDLILIRFIIERFGYRPKKLRLFKEALTHKSIANTSKKLRSNERLEFLGDAIFDAIVADYLFEKFPKEDEGYLTKIKSKVVNRKSLSAIAAEIGLIDHIIYQKGRTIKVSTLEGNALEAIFGAIYLDGGYQAVYKTVKYHIFRKYTDLNTLLEEEIDFKSKLYIWAQKNKLPLDFKVLKEENLGHKWNYQVEVIIQNKSFGMGSGSSKKIAEQAASKETLLLMGEI
ncbi:RNAse III [Lishizhenia tianjinensis]|uniref:Ribonuclease 3 n=1 Tax=Lishizhenia tianjinensis TaxID=477690 RepID=A0A1I6ZMW3_9FLAO|nr:ribonuclease III [Lishizhenia tianjinensis]SFT64046.1 RNAse III [Lishizhenia tianjinensis]